MRKTAADPATLALNALTWLVADGDGIERFLSLSGMDTGELRARAGSDEMDGAVLDFLLAQEDLLLRFCEDQDVAPQEVHRAQLRLCGGGAQDF